jgi:hypothetical protein
MDVLDVTQRGTAKDYERVESRPCWYYLCPNSKSTINGHGLVLPG